MEVVRKTVPSSGSGVTKAALSELGSAPLDPHTGEGAPPPQTPPSLGASRIDSWPPATRSSPWEFHTPPWNKCLDKALAKTLQFACIICRVTSHRARDVIEHRLLTVTSACIWCHNTLHCVTQTFDSIPPLYSSQSSSFLSFFHYLVLFHVQTQHVIELWKPTFVTSQYLLLRDNISIFFSFL